MRATIARWQTQNNFPQPYLTEWLDHLDQGLPHLLAFLASTSEDAARLRSSSPFVGILSQSEREEIFHRFRDQP